MSTAGIIGLGLAAAISLFGLVVVFFGVVIAMGWRRQPKKKGITL